MQMLSPEALQEIKMHMGEHISYPATREEIIEACSGMSHVPESEREWVKENLPPGTYNSSEEVMKALKVEQ